MKFTRTQEGWYKAEGTDIIIKDGVDYVKTTNVGFCTLEKYKYIRIWMVCRPNSKGELKNERSFKYLKDAKAYAEEMMSR